MRRWTVGGLPTQTSNLIILSLYLLSSLAFFFSFFPPSAYPALGSLEDITLDTYTLAIGLPNGTKINNNNNNNEDEDGAEKTL